MSVSKTMRPFRQHRMKLAAILLCAVTAAQPLAQVRKPATAAPAAPAAPAPAAAAPVATPATGPAVKPAAGGFVPPASSAGKTIDSIAVVVNDDVITRNEIEARTRSVEARMKASNAPIPDAADLQRQVVEAIIVERAQQQLAKEMGIKTDDQQLDRAIARIAEQQKMTLPELRAQMEKEGMPFATFREEIRNEISLQRLREHEVDAKITISDAEVDTYLAAEKAANADKVEVNISQILVRIPENATPEQTAARKARADELMRQLRTGADFGKMAATYSDAPDALKGGEVGWRDPNRLPPLFAGELAKLSPGQVTPVSRSATGGRSGPAADPCPPHLAQGHADHDGGRSQAQAGRLQGAAGQQDGQVRRPGPHHVERRHGLQGRRPGLAGARRFRAGIRDGHECPETGRDQQSGGNAVWLALDRSARAQERRRHQGARAQYGPQRHPRAQDAGSDGRLGPPGARPRLRRVPRGKVIA